MAGRIAVGRLGRFIRQKCVLPTRLLLFGRAQQTRSLCGFCGAGDQADEQKDKVYM